jgi:hypothetical protein
MAANYPKHIGASVGISDGDWSRYFFAAGFSKSAMVVIASRAR